jgi:hypothetical protein
MNKEQQELLDTAYENYCLSYKDGHEFYEDETVKRSYTQEEFINKCKTDTEFSEKWGLKIEERELSVIERIVIAENSTEIIPGFDSHFDTDEDVHKVLDTWNTPTKLITITYNDKTIESYEKILEV